jgi:hypothetical protein
VFVSAIVIAPVLGLAVAARSERADYRRLARRSLLILVWPVAAITLFFLLFYRNPDVVASRGEMDLSVLGVVERALDFGGRFVWMIASPEWGQRLTSDVLGLGVTVLTSSTKAAAVGAAAVLLAVWTVATWQSSRIDWESPRRVGLLALCAGILWFILPLLFPAVLVRGQILEYRLLYFPLAGLAVVGGVVAWMISRELKRNACDRLLVAAVGLMLLFNTTAMMGYSYAFAMRHDLDRRQVDALVRSLPAEYLAADTYLIPVELDERLFGRQDSISRFLVGVFETSWSARAVLVELYSRTDFEVITSNRWVPLSLDLDGRSPPDQRLRVAGAGGYGSVVEVPLSRAVLFRYRGGEVAIVDSLTIVGGDGTQRTARFPLTQGLRGRDLLTEELVIHR